METTTEPKLAPPGAGVPLTQLLAMKLVIKPFLAERSGWEENNELFSRIARKVEHELSELSPEQLARKVLVPSQLGLEDSSRFWSIAMTLEHIVIVGRQIQNLLREMDQGRVPDRMADTALVKPSGRGTPQETLEAFRAFCWKEFPELLPSLKNRRSRLKFRHPWFGPMTSRAWFWLQAQHLALHLKQIREIRKELS